MLDCTISGNTANNGGGIFNSGTVTLAGCTLSRNSTSGIGGAALSVSGTMNLTDCTISGNTAPFSAGLYLGGTSTLIACTISANTATLPSGGLPAGIYIRGTTTLVNTIVAGNSGPSGASDIGGLGAASGSHNLIGTGLFSGSNNLLGVTDPKLGPLMYNGGPTQTMMPAANSPAIAAGDKTLLPAILITDQRGAPRIAGGNVDIGAVERQPQATIVVTTLADEDNGTIDPTVGQGTSLREAIDFANADPGGGDTISFAPGLQGEIDLSPGALPTITAAMTIDGPGANLLTLDAQGAGSSGILSIQAGAILTISGLTLANGSSTSNGGAINNNGTLTMTDCTVSGSSAAVYGGGLFNGGILTMSDCTVAANTAGRSGGGIFNTGGTLNMSDCTVAGNSAASNGGGILNQSTLTLLNCTVAGNSAMASGGGLGNAGITTVTMSNTIVAKNTPGGDILNNGNPLAGGNNLIGDGSGGLAGAITGDPKLGPLAWNGGPTQTMALLAGSPALGKGAAGPSADQRGFPVNSPPDLGAFPVPGPAALRDDLRADISDRPGRCDLHAHGQRPHALRPEGDVHLHRRLEGRRHRCSDCPRSRIGSGPARLRRRGLVLRRS